MGGVGQEAITKPWLLLLLPHCFSWVISRVPVGTATLITNALNSRTG